MTMQLKPGKKLVGHLTYKSHVQFVTSMKASFKKEFINMQTDIISFLLP